MQQSASHPRLDAGADFTALARCASLAERLRAAAELLASAGFPNVQAMVFGRRAAASFARCGTPAFAFDAELVSRRRDLVAALLAESDDGRLRIELERFGELAPLGRPGRGDSRPVDLLPLTSGGRLLGVLALDGASADDAGFSVLRAWCDMLAGLLANDLRAALFDEIEIAARSMRDESEVESILSVLTDALALEFGETAAIYTQAYGEWRCLAVSPASATPDPAALAAFDAGSRASRLIDGTFAVPMVIEGETWGVATVGVHELDRDHVRFVQAIVADGELAVGGALAVAHRRKLARETSALCDAGHALLGVTRAPAMAQTVSRLAVELTEAHEGGLFVASDSGYEASGFTGADASAVHDPRLFEEAIRLGAPVTGAAGMLLVLPLGGSDESMPSLVAVRRAPGAAPFGRDAVRVLENFGALATLAIRNVELLDQTTRMNRELTESNSFKDDLLAMFTHDFKGPLTVIAGYGELLLSKMRGDEQESLAIMLSQVKRLVALADDALSLARAQATGFVLEPKVGELSQFVADVLATSFFAQRDRIVFAPRSNRVEVGFDALAMRHVVENLVGNALKYSSDRIEVEVVEEHGEAGILVRDHGIGIPAAELPKVFDRFTRASNARRRGISGSGVGLYISKRLVEQQGGRIFAASAEGEGSTFDVRLPINRRKNRR